MIDPAVRISHVEPDGFAAVCASLAQRDRRPRREVSIVHADGVVRKVVSTFGADPGVGAGDRIDDPHVAARRVHAETGADLVTVIDEHGLSDLSPRLTQLARSSRSQGELLWRARVLWHEHPGVVTVPDPSPPRWPAVAKALAAVPDGHWVVLESTASGGSGPFRLAGQVMDGLLVTITSAPDGAVALRVRAPAAVFDAVLRADDPWAELRRQHDTGALSVDGLELFTDA